MARHALVHLNADRRLRLVRAGAAVRPGSGTGVLHSGRGPEVYIVLHPGSFLIPFVRP